MRFSIPLNFAVAAAVAVAALPVQAQNMKPGLWEIKQKPQLDTATQAHMAEAQKAMASMPAEQRQMMEQMLSKQGVSMSFSGGGIAIKTCISKEQAERNAAPVTDAKSKCTHNSQRSGNIIKVKFQCTEPPSEGESTVTIKGGGAGFTNSTRITHQRNGKAETMTVDGEAIWLGADCGTLKPADAR